MGVNGASSSRGRSRSSSSYDSGYSPPPPPALPNPKPDNFKFVQVQEVKNHIVVKVNYPDANNYEGNKVMLYRNAKLIDLVNQKTLDPHFSNSKKMLSPFARFEPTEDGWKAAITLAGALV
jgi:hypothetical protein